MNETMKTILKRRSVRAYTDVQLTAEEMDTIVNAGLYAPSAMGEQQWLFVAVRDKEFMGQFGEDCKKALSRGNDPYYGAPAAVFVFGESAGYEPLKDGSCAIATMGIAAASLDIASCWINAGKEFFPTERGQEYLKLLGVKDGYTPVGALILGHAKNPLPAAEARRENIVIHIG